MTTFANGAARSPATTVLFVAVPIALMSAIALVVATLAAMQMAMVPASHFAPSVAETFFFFGYQYLFVLAWPSFTAAVMIVVEAATKEGLSLENIPWEAAFSAMTPFVFTLAIFGAARWFDRRHET